MPHLWAYSGSSRTPMVDGLFGSETTCSASIVQRLQQQTTSIAARLATTTGIHAMNWTFQLTSANGKQSHAVITKLGCSMSMVRDLQSRAQFPGSVIRLTRLQGVTDPDSTARNSTSHPISRTRTLPAAQSPSPRRRTSDQVASNSFEGRPHRAFQPQPLPSRTFDFGLWTCNCSPPVNNI